MFWGFVFFLQGGGDKELRQGERGMISHRSINSIIS